MSIVRCITKREKGLEFIQDYDIALLRLKCYQEDAYRGIAPNINASDFNPEPPILACEFCSTSGFEEIIALANEDGKFALQDTRIKKQADAQLQGTQAHCDAIFDIGWMPQEMKLITASGDHTARLWDVSTSNIKELQSFEAHTRSIKNIVFRPQDKAVFATGARDGAIMIWDIRANYSGKPKPDDCIHNAHYKKLPIGKRQNRTPSYIAKQNRAQGITGLVFQDDYTLLSCSTGDGLIKIWDLRKNYSVHKKDPIAKHILNYGGQSNSNGFTSLLVCPSGITLYASCMDNTIYAYNISSYNLKPIAEYYGHQSSTFYVKTCLSPDGKYLASGSSDEMCYIWHTRKPGFPLLKLTGHWEEVSCIAWSNVGETKIITCTDYSRHRIWRIGKEYVDEDEKINICGYAEPICALVSNRNEILTLETTPTISKPQVNRKYSSESYKTPVNTTSIKLVEESKSSFGSTKRNFTQMSNGYKFEGNKTILSPVEENLKKPTKRCSTANGGARQLFISSTKIEMYENKSIEACLSNGYESDEFESNLITKSDISTSFSPTSNLPNFVVDGTAPHLLEMSPQKLKENVDWLTKIRKEKYAKQICQNTQKLLNLKNNTRSVCRTSKSRFTESHKTPINTVRPLSQFFRPAIKDCNNDHLETTTIIPCTSLAATYHDI